MISHSWILNVVGAVLLVSTAAGILVELRSSALIPKSMLLWPVCLIAFGLLTLAVGWLHARFSLSFFLGAILAFCGVQAALVNIRKLQPWPSGIVWLLLVPAGVAFQFSPLFLQRVIGLVWAGVGIAKILRERGAALEGGNPLWAQLLFLQAVILAAYRP